MKWAVRGVVLVVIAGSAVAFALRDPSPVGYYTSAQAQDRYLAAYQQAMADMPEPDRILDVRTRYGVVRLYHFAGPTGTTSGPGSGPGVPGKPGENAERAPLLLLPGRTSGAPVWADNMPTLLRLRSVYTIDLLGEPGMSVQQRPISNSQDHAAWLHEVLMNLPEPRIHLVGMSIGGWTAMNLVVHRPDKVASVMLLDPVLVFADLSWRAVVRSIPASVRWFPKSWRDSFASWTANGAPVEDVPVARMIEAGMQTYKLDLSQPARITERQLSAIRTPTLALLAGESRMQDTVAAEKLARRAMPEATVVVYPDASHAINGEYPDRIASDVAAFLAATEK